MANDAVEAAGEADGGGKKKFPLAPVIVVAAVMLVEAVVVAGLFLFMGGPAEVQADETLPDVVAAEEAPVEILLIAARFQNRVTGENFLYDTEIYGETRAKHEETVQELVDKNMGTIKSRINTIFRSASPSHLDEPDLATLKRQVKAALLDEFGNDPDGKPYLEAVYIAKCTRLPGDF